MEASELRIGNYLHFKNTQDLAIVDLIHRKHFDCRDEYGSFIPNGNYEPIGLTDEWFYKFGFKYNDLNGDTGHFQIITENGMFEVLRGEECYSYNYDLELKYVHELQNLCYILKRHTLHTGA